MNESEQQGPEQTGEDTERKLRAKVIKLEAKVEWLQMEWGVAKQTLADWEDGYLTEMEEEVMRLKKELHKRGVKEDEACRENRKDSQG